MKAALIVHPARAEAREVASAFVAAAAARGIDAEEAEHGLPGGTDVVVAVGGDGTVLEAVRRSLSDDLPVLGINVGNVGYLAAVDPDRITEAVRILAEGSFAESTRMTIEVEWAEGTTTGINDVVLEKVVSQHAIWLSLHIDGRHFTTYRADGVVVATPTGSTAYAFSAGGPMLDPELEALVVTPVAAHNLFAPNVVLSAASRLDFEVLPDRPLRINVDGRECAVVEPGSSFQVRRGDRRARFVMPWARPFDQVVREKFRLDDGL